MSDAGHEEGLEMEDIIDIEEHAKAGKRPPRARRYRIRVDRTPYVVEVPGMTGRELLVLTGKQPPEQFAIYEKVRGGQNRKIELGELADFTRPGVERFLTLPLDQTEGLVEMRRNFRLPQEDELFLESLGLPWETVTDGGVQRLVIHGVPVCPGYNHAIITLYFRIEPPYPDGQLDMVFVHPALIRQDGRVINSLAEEKFDGKTWQRWSRHRTPSNPWRPGIDNVESHLALVGEWFRQEFAKR